ncbi:unnamed protein product, partial [Symbiodinium sp. CCMP2456]
FFAQVNQKPRFTERATHGPAAASLHDEAGVPLPARNSVIHMPSGLTSVNSPSKDGHLSSAAPAQVRLMEGWTGLAHQRARRSRCAWVGVDLLRPTASATLMTSSPTGQPMFGEPRYQLFPPPIQEVCMLSSCSRVEVPLGILHSVITRH